MKKIFFTLFFFSILSSLTSVHGVEIEFIGPCDDNVILKTELDETFSNVGELTIAALKKNQIPFKGEIEGINSMFNTPTGDDALEILSDFEMRAYGWCFTVDGIIPEVYPHEVPITSKNQKILWYFGYAHYDRGEWVGQCLRASSLKPDFLCKKIHQH